MLPLPGLGRAAERPREPRGQLEAGRTTLICRALQFEARRLRPAAGRRRRREKASAHARCVAVLCLLARRRGAAMACALRPRAASSIGASVELRAISSRHVSVLASWDLASGRRGSSVSVWFSVRRATPRCLRSIGRSGRASARRESPECLRVCIQCDIVRLYTSSKLEYIL